MTSRGTLYVHSAVPALCPHLEWAIEKQLGARPSLSWTSQPAAPGARRTELTWYGAPGTGAALASALAAWHRVRFEVTEDPIDGDLGHRYSYTPSLGMFHGVTDAIGDLLVSETRLRQAVANATARGADLHQAIDAALGTAWDLELEPFRYAGEGAPVRVLHQVV